MSDARTKGERRLLTFVQVIAFLERMGNALGRLVLIWATVVVGFSKDLGDHFWFLAGFVILESFRAFSRESKSDDQLLFKTTGAIKLKRVSLPIGSLYYVNAVAIALFFVCGVATVLPLISGFLVSTTFLPLVLVLSKVNKTRIPKLIEKMSMPGNSWWLRFMPAGALILATAVGVFFGNSAFALPCGAAAILQWFIFDSSARGQLPAVFSCLRRVKHLRAILITGIALSLLLAFQNVGFVTMVAPLVLGNLQIPVSMTRIMLALSILVGGDDFDLPDNKTHLGQALKAFYIMVLCQGTLYILASILESFSYFPRRSLALRCRLVDKVGLESISLHYEQAYDKFVQESVLDAKDMGLVTFAVDSLNSEVSHDKKLAAVRILHSFLQQQDVEATNTKVVSEITGSTKAVTTLISMLGSIVPEDADIRLFAAKVVADLARYLRITGIPGTMQMVSSLLDVKNRPGSDTGNVGDQELREASGSPGVDGNGRNAGDQEIEHTPSFATVDPRQGNSDNQAIRHTSSSSATANDNRGNIVDQQIRRSPSSSTLNVENEDNQSRIQDYPIQASRNSEEESSRMCKIYVSAKNKICKIYQDMKKLWSIGNDTLKGEGSLRVLGLSILGSFSDDVDNCAEISRATDVLPKIIGLISLATSTTTPQQKHVTTSSLVLVAKLASVEWKSGVTLRKELCENPFLVSKLAEILADSYSGPEQWKLAMDIIAKLAMDEETRQEIGGIQAIVSKLMHVFLGRDEASNTYEYDHSLRTAAGQALAMLAMESVGNCSAILDEPVYNTIVHLSRMFIDYENEYLVANILQSLLAHYRDDEPRHRNRLNEQMSSGFRVELLARIVGAEGKRMEALIGLASQICNVVRELFIHDLETEPHLDAAAFVQKLVYELNAHKRPSPEFPRMRRALVELTISMVESCGRYAAIFKDHGMVEALSKVEKTTSKVEKYRLFYGSAGVVPEGGATLSNLVATAKGLVV